MALKRVLGLKDVFAISTGAMISSGLFVLPGLAFAKSGPAMILAYVLAAVLIIPSMLAKAELSTAMPRSGGSYLFIDRSMGPVWGTFGGFANWFSLSLKSAFALVGIGAFAILIFPEISPFQIKLIAVGACLVFTVLNLFSVKTAGQVQVTLVFFLIAILIVYIGRGFIATAPTAYQPFMPKGLWSLVSTAGLVFVSFGGLTKIASVAEEVKSPTRNIPLGMMLSFAVVTLLYILAVAVTVGIVPGSELKGSLIPLSLGADRILGPAGRLVLAAAAIMAFITTGNAGIMAASRTPLAMSRDQLLPSGLGHVHPRLGTPVVSILLTSGFMVAVILFLSIENLVKTASTLMILLFMMDNLAVMIMRESRIRNYRPKFKVPLYPWLPIFALVAYSFLLVEMGRIPMIISVGFMVLGWLTYRFYSRDKVSRTSALMHIVERITAKELRSRSLEEELKEIVIERDEILEDRFDRLIKASMILDIDERRPVDQVLRTAADILAPQLECKPSQLFARLMEREGQSGTVIRPGLAIPHVIVPGEKRFAILPIRCNAGIQFSSAPDPVHTLFVMAGSVDERNYHLRALMAIAHLVHETDFEAHWLAAVNVSELKDVILLSGRKRDKN